MPFTQNNRISVALCVYNGQRYLERQLQSILDQARMPDEVVICDDCSTDRSLEIVTAFAAKAPFSVRIYQNEHNLGSTRSFERAISLCDGDFIALSDQDDIWRTERLAISERTLSERPEVGLVFSDADLIDENGQPLNGRLWQTVRFREQDARQLEAGNYILCVRSRFVTGATIMFRANLRGSVLPTEKAWIHDEWIAASLPLFADIHPIAEPLIFYRKHASQQVGTASKKPLQANFSLAVALLSDSSVAKIKHWDHLQRAVESLNILLERFSESHLSGVGEDRLRQYRVFSIFMMQRLQLPKNRLIRCGVILSRAGQYQQFGTVLEIVKDLLSKL